MRLTKGVIRIRQRDLDDFLTHHVVDSTDESNTTDTTKKRSREQCSRKCENGEWCEHEDSCECQNPPKKNARVEAT